MFMSWLTVVIELFVGPLVGSSSALTMNFVQTHEQSFHLLKPI